MDNKPKNIIKKLSRKGVKKQLTIILNLFDIAINKDAKLPKEKFKDSDSLQDIIDYIRVSVKYKLFETDVLNREIKALKKICKDNGIDLK